MSDDELWDWWQAKRLWEKTAPAAAVAAEEAPKKAMQKGMEKAAAPAEEAHKKAMQKGMKKKAVSTEKAHWKSLKKRMKRAITRRAPGEPPPEKPRQKGTLKNQIIKAKFVKRHEHLIPSSYLRALWWPKKGDQESHESQAV